jgi:hypothetical protein
MKIDTRQQCGGIWTAVDDDTYDGPCCPIGVGRTEAAAIADLMDQIEEQESREEEMTMKIDPQAMRNAYAEVEILKGKLNSLYFKMEEAVPDDSNPKLAQRYLAAKDVVSAAADDLLAALDHLRT